ncbi:hypothetical protein ACFL10_00270 [Patescibacteria group bacterium]
MTERPTDPSCPQESPSENLKTNQTLDPQIKQKLEELLPDLRSILLITLGKWQGLQKGLALSEAIEGLEMIIGGKSNTINLPTILISLPTILHTAQISFNGHETKFTSLCESLIKEIKAMQID